MGVESPLNHSTAGDLKGRFFVLRCGWTSNWVHGAYAHGYSIIGCRLERFSVLKLSSNFGAFVRGFCLSCAVGYYIKMKLSNCCVGL